MPSSTNALSRSKAKPQPQRAGPHRSSKLPSPTTASRTTPNSGSSGSSNSSGSSASSGSWTPSASSSSEASHATVRRVSGSSKLRREAPVEELFDHYNLTIEDARSAADTLCKLVLLKPPADLLNNEMVTEYSELCQTLSYRLETMLNHPSLNMRQSKRVLGETYRQLQHAIQKHQIAVLNALQVMGVSHDQIQAALDQQQQSNSARLNGPTLATPATAAVLRSSGRRGKSHSAESSSASSRSSAATSNAGRVTSSSRSNLALAATKPSESANSDDEIAGLRHQVLRLMFLTRLDRIPHADELASTSGLISPALPRTPSDTASQKRGYYSPRGHIPASPPLPLSHHPLTRRFSEPSLRQPQSLALASFTTTSNSAARGSTPCGTQPSSRTSSGSKESIPSDPPSDKLSETSESSNTSAAVDVNSVIQELRQQVAILGQRVELPSASERAESALNRMLWKRLVEIGDESVKPKGELRQFADTMIPDLILEASTPTEAARAQESSYFSNVDWQTAGLGPQQLSAVKSKPRPMYNHRMDSGYGSSEGSSAAYEHSYRPRRSSVILE